MLEMNRFLPRAGPRLQRVGSMALMALVVTVLGGCDETSEPGGPSDEPNVTDLVVVPDSVTVQPGDTVQFHAYGRTPEGDSVAVEVNWSATRGTINDSGLYGADATEQQAQVTATVANGSLEESAKVGKRYLVEAYLVPEDVTLAPGGAQQFDAFGVRNSEDTIPVPVNFTAEGVEINTNGLYTAGSEPGSYEVVGTHGTSGLSDTAGVTIVEGPPPPRRLPEGPSRSRPPWRATARTTTGTPTTTRRSGSIPPTRRSAW